MTPDNKRKNIKDKEKSPEKKQALSSDPCGCVVVDPCGCYVDPCGCHIDPCGCYEVEEIECADSSCGCINFR